MYSLALKKELESVSTFK